jgi:hypothetical protein
MRPGTGSASPAAESRRDPPHGRSVVSALLCRGRRAGLRAGVPQLGVGARQRGAGVPQLGSGVPRLGAGRAARPGRGHRGAA